MEFFYSTELAIPIFQIALLLILSTMALLFGRAKLALLINYLFTMYWGYLFNRENLLSSGLEGFNSYAAIYFGIGLIVVILAVIGFLYSE
jgi:hypothetical protein